MKTHLLLGCSFLLASVAHASSLTALDTAGMSRSSASPVQPKSLSLRPAAFSVGLEPLSLHKSQLGSDIRHADQVSGAPIQVGLRRKISALQSWQHVNEVLKWSVTSRGGQVAAISIISPEAMALRMGVLVTHLPTSAVLRFYSQQDNQVLEIHASKVLQVLAANQAAGDDSEQARTYWSPPVTGDEITLEIELPSSANRDQLQVSIPTLSHLFADPAGDLEKNLVKGIGQSGTCNVNYQCDATYNTLLDAQSRSVAKMSFIDQGDAYICTGTLLNNTRQDRTPYFLSANHCISSQISASTLVTYWLYRAATCQGVQLDGEFSMLYGGAQLLYTNKAQDTSFFRLNDLAPEAVAFSGWSTNPGFYNFSQTIIGLHNPSGDLQKISKGAVVNYLSCDDSFCYRSTQARATAVEVLWSAGVTEGGSSGSGLYSDGKLIAQLYGGSSACNNPTGYDRYSLLAPAYENGIKQWLAPSGTSLADGRTVVEFYNPDLNHYFITADAAEQAFVDSGAVGRWLRTGQSFKAGGSVAACRFYGNTNVDPATNAIYGPNSHFYTVDQQGCNQLISIFDANIASWKFESYDFFSTPPDANGRCPGGTIAVHRFYNDGFAKGKPSNHRFVTDASLIQPMVRDGWLYEGVDMCAPL